MKDKIVELAHQSMDCSFLLTHLIRQSDNRSDSEAKQILNLILNIDNSHSSPYLKASRVGWYGRTSPNIYNPITQEFNGTSNNNAVCLTESTLSGLKAHRDIFSAKYGVAFERDFLFKKGANPCLNIRQSLLKEEIKREGESYPRSLFNFIPSQLHPFVNIIHESFDATQEREWRIPGDFKFDYGDLLFIFCPTDEFSHFSKIQKNAQPILFDLDLLDRI